MSDSNKAIISAKTKFFVQVIFALIWPLIVLPMAIADAVTVPQWATQLGWEKNTFGTAVAIITALSMLTAIAGTITAYLVLDEVKTS